MPQATRDTPFNQPIDVKTEKATGLIPKNIQSWVIFGVSAVMILVMWLTAGKSRTPSAGAKAVSMPAKYNATLVPLNDAKIQQMQKRIEELQLEQLQVAREAQASGVNPGLVEGIGRTAAPGTENLPGEGLPSGTADSTLEATEKQRRYLARFASNIALSYRPEMRASEAVSASDRSPTVATPSVPASSGIAPSIMQLPTIAAPLVPSPVQSIMPTESSSAKKTETSSPDVGRPGGPNSSTGEKFVLFEGTLLEVLLMNRLDGSFAGPVNAMVTTDVYSHDRQHQLVPAGTKVFGETRKVEAFGQNRLAVVFHRLIMPDGYSVSLDQFKGLNQVGETALKDKVNNHYTQIFGVSLAIGLLGSVAQSGSGNILEQSATDRLRSNFGATAAGSGEQILEKFLNITPAITIREGTRMKIYLSDDLLIPDYQLHTIRPSL